MHFFSMAAKRFLQTVLLLCLMQNLRAAARGSSIGQLEDNKSGSDEVIFEKVRDENVDEDAVIFRHDAPAEISCVEEVDNRLFDDNNARCMDVLQALHALLVDDLKTGKAKRKQTHFDTNYLVHKRKRRQNEEPASIFAQHELEENKEEKNDSSLASDHPLENEEAVFVKPENLEHKIAKEKINSSIVIDKTVEGNETENLSIAKTETNRLLAQFAHLEINGTLTPPPFPASEDKNGSGFSIDEFLSTALVDVIKNYTNDSTIDHIKNVKNGLMQKLVGQILPALLKQKSVLENLSMEQLVAEIGSGESNGKQSTTNSPPVSTTAFVEHSTRNESEFFNTTLREGSVEPTSRVYQYSLLRAENQSRVNSTREVWRKTLLEKIPYFLPKEHGVWWKAERHRQQACVLLSSMDALKRRCCAELRLICPEFTNKSPRGQLVGGQAKTKPEYATNKSDITIFERKHNFQPAPNQERGRRNEPLGDLKMKNEAIADTLDRMTKLLSIFLRENENEKR